MRRISVLAVLLSLSLASLAQSNGEALFVKNCANCHATDLSGKTAFGTKVKIPDLRSAYVQGQTDEQLFASIGRGVGHKEYPHGFLSRGLSPAQVSSLVVYIRSMKK